MKKRILIIDDEINIGLLLSTFLTKNGFEVVSTTSGTAALSVLSEQAFDLVLCDYRLDDTDGKEILIKIKENYPGTSVIIITGYSDIRLAVELIKLGAYDYIAKPLYPDEILITINKALAAQQSISEHKNATPQKNKDRSADNFLNHPEYVDGKSEASRTLVKQIKLIAPTDYSIILTGKSGTGKECVAKAIHLNSPRKDKPFVVMDCGALSTELAASEFFGHEKGSFTGALATKIGHFEEANGGTLFLDEIGNLSYEIQAILLRAVQERKLKRIGSTKEIDLNIRLIVATNENLIQNIQKGTFREDLYHRFNEFAIHVPSLKNRGKDILTFAKHFLTITNRELNKNLKGFSEEVKTCFMNYSWPGNIRELKNVIRRVSLLTEGSIIPLAVLPQQLIAAKDAKNTPAQQAKSKPGSKKATLRNARLDAELTTILTVLKQVNFNKSKAAKILNIDRKTLYNKITGINLNELN
ncbi:sigma-54-dependent transcriptional regulator [Pedobacter soli]|uniref:Two-component system, NtrC family, response regulator HydG n=1 Tax=Pedobacter soli TaxID=390242 RepID=A0A1G6PXG4_9SPHI|nr:sigma-54 dependent transcriptional regulator [Pedobacter soli]SDC84065.1 two-component system, NtrC family, response regulator HydG [Pedobacter soli]